MGVQINRGEPGSKHIGILDPGTGTVAQASEPVVVTSDSGNRESAKVVDQQPKKVEYRDVARNDQATGAVEQLAEPVVSGDPGLMALRKSVKDVEDKSVKGGEDKSEKKTSTKGTRTRR